jgi:pimeloyl-ACP methyl ester carboxylesterase
VTDAIAGLEERFGEARGLRMRYLVGGDGPPLVLIHGLTGAASNWVELAPRLAQSHRVLVPDLPGHGRSAPLPSAPNLDVYAERVHLLADVEGMLPAPLVGHSMGGLVALRLAVRRPEAVRGLVLAASAGIGSVTRRAQFWVSVFGFTRPGRKVAPLRGVIARHPRLRPPIFNRYQTSDSFALSPEVVEGFLAAAPLHTDVVSAGRALVRDDPRLDLERVGCPCLVLWGARDLQVPIEDAFEYARRLNAPLRTIADCGHLLIGERPDAVVDAVQSFLDSLPTEHERAPGRVGEAGLSPARAEPLTEPVSREGGGHRGKLWVPPF